MPIFLRYPLLAWVLFAASVGAAPPKPEEPRFSADQIEFFEEKVRPLLVEHCHACHSARSKKQRGGLRLDDRESLLKGGDSGPAFVLGKPAESLLLRAVRWQSIEMPPRGKLKPAEIATLEKWIALGAPWAAENPGTVGSAILDYDWEKWRNHWAFRPVTRPEPPRVDGTAGAYNAIDRFVLAKLRQAELKPVAAAPASVLIRRIFFDLTGLPPTPEQVDVFTNAHKQDPQKAIAHLVDQLLESPRYGERWGRHWLDVARYSDGHGGFLDNKVYDHAWRYRDWVVDAFNADMPYDEFLRLQIAGDLLGKRQDAVATGFFALGPTYISDGGDPDSVAQAKAETLSDRLDTLSRGMLGLTLACARCHDHKFDPIPQQDYYSLAGVFNNTTVHDAPLADPKAIDAFNQHQQTITSRTKQVNDLQNRIKTEKRSATAEEKKQLDEWNAEVAKLRQNAPKKPATAHALRDSGSGDMKIAIRGDLRKPGEPAPRRFLRILAGNSAPAFEKGSGREQLAWAVTDPKNPLTPRVLVNRVWMHHFGEGLVRTPSNFGALGEKPTHPELLDWLTAEFLKSNQSIKSLHRLILLSATYQRSSDFNAMAFQKDGDNRLLWRMNRRRLDVESWRDALLQVTGELDTTRGGPPSDRIDTPRRTLYFKVSRNGDVFGTDEFLRRFDFPLMRATIDQRPTSIAPQQFLFLMNSPFMVARARALGKRLAEEAKDDPERIRLAYRLLYQRPATEEEVALGTEFLAQTAPAPGLSPWEQYAQVLLAANEFMSVK